MWVTGCRCSEACRGGCDAVRRWETFLSGAQLLSGGGWEVEGLGVRGGGGEEKEEGRKGGK